MRMQSAATRVAKMAATMAAMAIAAMLAVALVGRTATACPFCSAPMKTFGEEIESMDVAVIAVLAEGAERAVGGAAADERVPTARFTVVEVLKGKEHLAGAKSVETIYFGGADPGKAFLIMGVGAPKLMWSTPLPIAAESRDYFRKIVTLPKEGPERLTFFLSYLENPDDMLARDAYDEFAKAPYSEVQKIKDQIDHDQLLKWIESPDIPATRRRLYLTLLSIRGTSDDVEMLEKLLRSEDRKSRSGLDALVACYLTLQGPEGVDLVEELFLENKKAEYADTYAAIMALRFHGTEVEFIPRERLVEALRLMLDRPELADLVIPDLARWEDWDSMPRLTELFKNADEKSSWVRVPVINYLRACPLPEAKERIEELEKIDPEAVRRANTFFPFNRPAAPASSSASPLRRGTGEIVSESALTVVPANHSGRSTA
jgi:hypothetical protein